MNSCYALEGSNFTSISGSRIVEEGYYLRGKLLGGYYNKWRGKIFLRILVHVPEPMFSRGGNSVFSNINETLNFMGVESRILPWDGKLSEIIYDFKPNVLILNILIE